MPLNNKQYDKAKNQLELSIQHEPSDKAFHFLDLTRKKLIDKSSKSQPVIHLEMHETNQTVIRKMLYRYLFPDMQVIRIILKALSFIKRQCL